MTPEHLAAIADHIMPYVELSIIPVALLEGVLYAFMSGVQLRPWMEFVKRAGIVYVLWIAFGQLSAVILDSMRSFGNHSPTFPFERVAFISMLYAAAVAAIGACILWVVRTFGTQQGTEAVSGL